MKKNLNYINFSLVTLIQFIFIYLFFYCIPNNLKPYYLGYFVFLVIFVYLFESLRSFTFLVMGMFTIGFYYVLISWLKNSSYEIQLDFIIQQIIVILLGVLIWIESIYLKSIIDSNVKMESKIKELEKHNPEIGVLTLTEFLDKAEVIFTAIKRRNENSQVLVIGIKKFYVNNNLKTSKTILKILGEAVMNSIRKQFDIVGYLNENSLIVLLQNTDSLGSDLVIERLKNYIHNISQINYESIINNIQIEVMEFGSSFIEFKKYVDNLQNKEVFFNAI